MDNPVSDDVARNRWLIISALRLGGVAMVVIGILILRQILGGSPVVGYGLLAIGLIDFMVVPLLLARRWRSPKP